MKRLVGLSLSIFFLFSLLILQFYKIQIIEAEKWKRLARGQHQIVVIDPAKRGVFYSNTEIKPKHLKQEVPFVIDIAKFYLYVDPKSIDPIFREEISSHLTTFCRLNESQKNKIKTEFTKNSRSRKLISEIDQTLKDRILAWWYPFAKAKKIASNAIYFTKYYKRSYPFGPSLGQVLHTVREDAQTTGGLEMYFDKYLKGTDGKRLLLRSPRHPMDSGKVISFPEDGADVYLTINHCLQALAEDEIEKVVKRHNAKGGWVVMMDPNNGDILAMAQYPFFAPAEYRKFYNDKKLQEEVNAKPVTYVFEPGSIMKPLTLSICLTANEEAKRRGEDIVFSPEERIPVTDGHFPGRHSAIKDVSHHKVLNMNMGLQKSSNIYMGKVVQRVINRLGAPWYRNALENIFGLGIKTKIQIPSENAPQLPRLDKCHPNGSLEWSTATPYSLAIGYNLMCNAVQMTRAYSVIANGGFLVQPNIVKKIVKTKKDGSQQVIWDSHAINNKKRVLSPEVVARVTEALKYVTKPGGSGFRGEVYGYTEVGKTGTSEKIVNGVYSKQKHFSSFVGFTPVGKAKFVIFIGVDEAEPKYIPGVGKNHMGGFCAAPSFREIATKALHYLNEEEDDPYGYPANDPRFNLEKADWVKKSKELNQLYDSWNRR